MDAYQATGDRAALEAALDAAFALVEGQHRSGGWDYYVTFDPADKQPLRTCLDDDTTQAALRFLMRTDKALGFTNERLHQATLRGLDSLIRVQYPNGAWFVFWRRLPGTVRSSGVPGAAGGLSRHLAAHAGAAMPSVRGSATS